MPSVWVKHPVTVKARVTPDLKKRMASELQDTIRRLDVEIGQLDFQLKRLSFEGEKTEQKAAQLQVKQHLDAEKQKRLEKRSEILLKVREIAKLEDGTEIIQGTIEGMSLVEVGSDWESIFNTVITLEDGKVVSKSGS